MENMPREICDESSAKLPTRYYGEFKIVAFKTKDEKDHAAIVKGDVKGKENVLIRVHSECLTGDIFHSLRCDCGDQLEAALKMISKEKQGILLYLRQEGRGIGLFNKIKAYDLQEKGRDTVEANVELGFQPDERNFSLAVEMLKKLGVKSVRLMTNNPKKIDELKQFGMKVNERVPIIMDTNPLNEKYLDTKKEKMDHLFDE